MTQMTQIQVTKTLEYCVHNMICEECGLELDCDMDEAVRCEVIYEPCGCQCHAMI